MKPLDECVKDYKHTYWRGELPEDIMFDHFFIEFRLIGEHEGIVERYGRYNGQVELVSRLTEDIKQYNFSGELKEFVLNKEDLKDYDSVFYDKLTVVYDPNVKRTAYIEQENFDNETQRLKEVKIVLSATNERSRSRIRKSLMHELTHAWHDYCGYIGKGTDLTTLAQELKYYHNIRTYKTTKDGEQFCRDVMYLLSSIEKGAYSSEIYSELDELETKRIITWEQAKDIFRSSSTYKNFIGISKILKNINNKPVEFQTDFVRYYNKTNETDWTLHKISKKLLKRLDKLFDQVMKNCAKIYYEWSDQNELEECIAKGGFPYMDLGEFY